MPRELTKNFKLEVDEKEEEFKIQKMNSFDGAYLMKFVSEKAMPLLKALAVRMNKDGEGLKKVESLEMIGDSLTHLLESLDREDMKTLMMMCLQTVSIYLPAGYQEVLDENGNFGVQNLEYNAAVCLRLTYEVIVFNCASFFEESGLSSSLGSLLGSLQEQ